MNWKSHFLFAFILFLIMGYLLLNVSYLELFSLSIIAGFFSLFPDIDHELSKSRKILDKAFPLVSFLVLFLYFKDLYTSVLYAVLFSGFYFLFFTFLKPKHRGVTHSIFALILLSAIAYLFNLYLFYAFFLGYFSHLIGDMTFKLF